MWNPWAWASASHEGALANARVASAELNRRRVERVEVDLFLEQRSGAARTTEAG
ncbi:hypothetical protein [Nocardioides sp.]|uniref:hypothetical protein n=1 Tax=Nocardioides sp. TaxID=35761 RepID=UPI0037843C67